MKINSLYQNYIILKIQGLLSRSWEMDLAQQVGLPPASLSSNLMEDFHGVAFPRLLL